MESDSAYYRRRAGEELRAAATAGDAELKRRHLELAELLLALASQTASSEMAARDSLSPAGRGLRLGRHSTH